RGSASCTSDPGAVGRVALACDRAEVPVLIGLAIDETPHVKPRRGIRLARRARICTLADDRYGHVVAFGNNRHHLRCPTILVRNWPRISAAAEKIHDRLPSIRATGIVLNVLLGEPFRCLIPVTCFEKVSHDVHGGLLVGVQLGILAGEKGLRIIRSDDWILCSQQTRAHHASSESQSSEHKRFLHVCSPSKDLCSTVMTTFPRACPSTRYLIASATLPNG